MVAATLLWGATFVVIRDSLTGLSPGTLVAVRVWRRGRWCWAGRRWCARVRLGRRTKGHAAGRDRGRARAAGGYLFQAIGLTSTRAGSSAFLTSTGTLFAALFAWPLLGQRPGGRLVLGIAIALIGSALLGVRGDFRIGAGDAWTLLGALVLRASGGGAGPLGEGRRCGFDRGPPGGRGVAVRLADRRARRRASWRPWMARVGRASPT